MIELTDLPADYTGDVPPDTPPIGGRHPADSTPHYPIIANPIVSAARGKGNVYGKPPAGALGAHADSELAKGQEDHVDTSGNKSSSSERHVHTACVNAKSSAEGACAPTSSQWSLPRHEQRPAGVRITLTHSEPSVAAAAAAARPHESESYKLRARRTPSPQKTRDPIVMWDNVLHKAAGELLRDKADNMLFLIQQSTVVDKAMKHDRGNDGGDKD